jgi:hypothetical protein
MKNILQCSFWMLFVLLCNIPIQVKAQIITDNMGTTSASVPVTIPTTTYVSNGATYSTGLTQVGWTGGNRLFGSTTNLQYGFQAPSTGFTSVTFTLTFTVGANTNVSIPSLTFDAQRSGSGAPTLTVNINGSAMTVSGAPGNGALAAITCTGGPSNLTGNVAINIVLTGATSTSSNWTNRIDNLSVTGTVLPVELTEFNVEPSPIGFDLNWATASENDNDYFSIERSADGRAFESIGEVKGAGNTTIGQKYEFNDNRPLKGINYYRLKQVDFDGYSAYSMVRSIKNGGNIKASIFPSIIESGTTALLSIESEEEGDSNYFVYSTTGQLLLQQNIQVQKGRNTYDLNIADLPQGVYILKTLLGNSNEPQTQQFVVK